MPLPAARFTHPHVGAAGDQGSRVTARTDAQVRRLFRCGEPEYGEIHPADVRGVQCGHLRGIPQEIAATSLARHVHGDRPGQRSVPPCHSARPALAQIPPRSVATIPPAIQPAAGSDRACVEIGPAFGDAQSILCNTRRIAHCHPGVFRSVEKPQFRPAKIMRH